MHPQSADFLSLFDGYREAYGTYTVPEAGNKDGEKITGKARTIKRPLSVELWDAHLDGRQGLGIIPINAESRSIFGAIDIDQYDLDHVALNNRIVKEGLPLTVCRTKSGGAHLYLFMREAVDAQVVVSQLKRFAGHLGYGACEIFPRQVRLSPDRGDVGNWINIPYFDVAQGSRWAYSRDSEKMGVIDFIKHAYDMRKSPEELESVKLSTPENLPGGPPCLNYLCNQGFPKGTRNNGLFNLGVYAMKVQPVNGEWQKLVEQYNQEFMDPPLSSNEVVAVLKSLAKREYTYTCHAQPVQSCCDSIKCRTCQHGIGERATGMPRLGSLTKLATSPAIWFMDVETGSGTMRRIELSTEQLQKPEKFQLRCMELLNVMPPVIKMNQWHSIVSALLSSSTVIEVDEQLTPRGRFMEHLEEFCTSRVTAKVCDELLLGKPWIFNKEIHFRIGDLIKYFERVRFRDVDLKDITNYIRDIPGFRKQSHNIKHKIVACVVLPERTFSKQLEPHDYPKQDEGVL